MSNPHHGQLLSVMFFPKQIAASQLPETYLQFRKVQLNMRTMKGTVTKKFGEIQLQIQTAVKV